MSNNLPSPPKTPPILPPGAGGPLPPNVTPGWNDPPELSSTGSPSSGPKRLLNKRVAFPMAPPTSTASPTSPQTSPMPLTNDTTFNEIMNNFNHAVDQLPNNTVFKKDMDRMATNWNDIAANQEFKHLLLQASQYVRHGDVAQGEEVHKQLSMIPAAGWFTLFLHSIITALSSLKSNQNL